jgi:polyisoprenoid-binding protein YceI
MNINLKTTIILFVVLVGAILTYVFWPATSVTDPISMPTAGSDSANVISNTPSTTTDIIVPGATVYSIDNVASNISWEGKKKLIPWVDQGTIALKESTLSIKDNTLVSAKLVFDMNSIKTSRTGSGGGNDKLDGHLRSPDFFDVAVYPTATLVVDKVEGNTHTGTLTIKGKTAPITFTAQNTSENGTFRSVGTVKVDRTLYDVRFGSGRFFDNLGNNVIEDIFTITFDVKTK